METLQDKIDGLKALEDKYKIDREIVMEAILEVIRSIGQNPAITPISNNIFTIKASEIMDKPWSPGFHNWEVQAELLISILERKPANTWCDFIREIVGKRSSMPGFAGVTTDKVQLNQKFLQKVCEKL